MFIHKLRVPLTQGCLMFNSDHKKDFASVISSDLPCKDGIARFATVSLKPCSDLICAKVCRFFAPISVNFYACFTQEKR